MVGMLTMETSVEDPGVQPCKKHRKEEDPPVKTITNYFSPLSKSVEKVLSPPKSNIRDYFKSTQFAKENICNPLVPKSRGNVKAVNSPKDPQSPVTGSQKALKLKRQRKKVDLQSIQGEIPDYHQIVNITSDDSNRIQDSGTACMNVSFTGSDTAALLAQICNENEISGSEELLAALHTSTSNDCKKKLAKPSQPKKGRNGSMSRKRKYEDGDTLSTNEFVECVSDKHEKEEATKSYCTEILSSSSCSNSSLEVNLDETSVFHSDNVVTVSFEDFLKSQTDVSQALDTEMCVSENPVSTNHVAESGSGAERSDIAPLPAKALTVHVQVHKSPPKALNELKPKESGKTIASIFLRKSFEPEIECEVFNREEQSEKPIVKRKSNVVIEEEDLELAVLEVGASVSTKPKSTAEERQQFMKAFKQPFLEAGKPLAKRTSKLQDVKEKSLIEAGKLDEVSDKESTKLHKKINKKALKGISSGPNELCNTGEGKMKKLKKRGNLVEQANDVKSNDCMQDNNTVSKEGSQNDKLSKETSSVILRRSSRQRSSDGSQIKSPVNGDATASDTAPGEGSSLVLTPKVIHPAASVDKDDPVQVSTPKMSRQPLRKTSIYKSEMILSPEVHSPIR